MAMDEVATNFEGKVMFWQYVQGNIRDMAQKSAELCDRYGHTYSMSVYLGKQGNLAKTVLCIHMQ
jgi:hypothetical protein